MIIDELDAKLHPKLLRYVISLFKNMNVNKKGAQLLFTSHDMSTMKYLEGRYGADPYLTNMLVGGERE